MALKTEVNKLLDHAVRLSKGNPRLQPLADSAKEMKTRLFEPLRVAVVGIAKAGKSTFMNALMGDSIVDTGTTETTFTVGWFRYGETPSLKICFRDGSTQDAPFSDLSKWSVRNAARENDRLNDVKYVMIYYPSEVLRRIEFIDTPGLNSVYGTDAQNTEDFLAIQGHEDTLAEASSADAVIYAFSRSLSGFDTEVLQAFHEGGTRGNSPINSIGILTKIDATGIWGIDDYGKKTPAEAALPVTDKLMRDPTAQEMLFAVYPVCAKPAEGIAQLNEADREVLKKAAALDPDTLADLLYDARTFTVDEDAEFAALGPAAARKSLMGKLAQYGILEAAGQLRAGRSLEELETVMRAGCGIDKVLNILQSHFGNRTFLIKTQFIFGHLGTVLSELKQAFPEDRAVQNVCMQIREEMDNLKTSVQTLDELKVLQMYYNRQVDFQSAEELEDFLRVTGEYGRSPEERLGMEKGCTIAQFREKAGQKAGKWRARAADIMRDRAYVTAARTIARSYEIMYYHLSGLIEE